MEKSVLIDASSFDPNKRRITRSMSKSDVVLHRNKQVLTKKSKSETETQMPFLPEEIIYKILLLLPAEFLQEVMRFVCRTWREVIRNPAFTKSHLSESPNNSTFAIQNVRYLIKLYSLNKDKTTWNLIITIKHKYLADGVGLILTTNEDFRSLLLLNPITKKIVTLPKSPLKCFRNWAVGYSPSTSKYKVVCADYLSKILFILTVGVDKQWRVLVNSMTALITQSVYFRPLGIWGYVYWYDRNSDSVIILDLETEIFHKVNFFLKKHEGQLPARVAKPILSDRILSIGIQSNNECRWQFWELVDFKNGGEWRKVGSIDLYDRLSAINRAMGSPCRTWVRKNISPVAIIKGEVIFNRPGHNYFFGYNFKLRTISRLFNNVPVTLKLVFANSLVKL